MGRHCDGDVDPTSTPTLASIGSEIKKGMLSIKRFVIGAKSSQNYHHLWSISRFISIVGPDITWRSSLRHNQIAKISLSNHSFKHIL